ncbi:PAS domain-containing protein [Bradyrhizobium sp. JYMT SZCCT0180]|uniref:PAS domain-containing protein n=1 Tax=Bradyrhizobium sp. JYMT SZCCT0180 TaxID=2807666 RepID=UPI001BA8692C|nr:PAS domain-containing protein [Bradyrhizobium sp. JYMT SZCCT0180]MBR1211335.1 PAS domain-containing protein [Bradyrhizobium sp. JYMT SZCCT0180]
MKHPSSRQFFAYWDAKRGHARAPDRSEIEPSAVRELLGDIFVLGYETEAGFPFRVAGTRVCALLGRDAKDSSFSALFGEESRREVQDIVTYVAEEMLAAVAGITATSEDGRTAHLELLLLPFNNRAHAPISVTGLLAPFEDDLGTLKDFKLTSWRYLHRPEKLVPRALRKLAIARGFMVYEGITGR